MRSYLTIFSNQYPLKNYHAPLERLIIFHSSNFVTIFLKVCFFNPLLLNGTNQLLILEIQTLSALLRKSISNFIRPSPNSKFNRHNPKTLKFITRLRLGLSHLRYHKFKHNFQDSPNALCNCGLITKTTVLSLICR